ncbi:hypothetical protein HPP92_012293 [Vanilla planifolia]|uniref:peptidylprolyl isomerase n=1 Tax=Vanilla planifolia TaxID=51239 RepID=A0A835QRV0_VANPL|nr:hypothetical protein HPP92_012293 [Vanilla planifolia]
MRLILYGEENPDVPEATTTILEGIWSVLEAIDGRIPYIASAFDVCMARGKHTKRILTRETQNNCWSCKRRVLLIFPFVSTGLFFTYSAHGRDKVTTLINENLLLEQNKKIQMANHAPDDFPNFIRKGFKVEVVVSDKYVRSSSGLIYLDIQVGNGDCPKDGQQVTFHYVGYNESGRRIDSTYLKGSPANIRLGNNALVPGFEEGIHDMRPGGKRRIIIPPELGPPVGPSTFFSSKQFEVFDVELLNVKDCQRRTIAFYSDVVCN